MRAPLLNFRIDAAEREQLVRAIASVSDGHEKIAMGEFVRAAVLMIARQILREKSPTKSYRWSYWRTPLHERIEKAIAAKPKSPAAGKTAAAASPATGKTSARARVRPPRRASKTRKKR